MQRNETPDKVNRAPDDRSDRYYLVDPRLSESLCDGFEADGDRPNECVGGGEEKEGVSHWRREEGGGEESGREEREEM